MEETSKVCSWVRIGKRRRDVIELVILGWSERGAPVLTPIVPASFGKGSASLKLDLNLYPYLCLCLCLYMCMHVPMLRPCTWGCKAFVSELTSNEVVIAIEHNLIVQFYPELILRNLNCLHLENDMTQ
jgi:hypothetical protein